MQIMLDGQEAAMYMSYPPSKTQPKLQILEEKVATYEDKINLLEAKLAKAVQPTQGGVSAHLVAQAQLQDEVESTQPFDITPTIVTTHSNRHSVETTVTTTKPTKFGWTTKLMTQLKARIDAHPGYPYRQDKTLANIKAALSPESAAMTASNFKHSLSTIGIKVNDYVHTNGTKYKAVLEWDDIPKFVKKFNAAKNRGV